MNDLKHVIHVKEAGEAPAHEQHVLELHRTGARIGGLHPLFWIFLALIIIFFHLFLFRSMGILNYCFYLHDCRIIYLEYCAGPTDKYRIR